MSDVVHLTANTHDLAAWLTKAESLHRTLRPDMAPDYHATIQRILAEGAEMSLVHENHAIRALAVFRAFHNTWNGYRFYIDDLVTDQTHRSAGHGARLLQWCETLARAKGCTTLTLESGTQRHRAHHFYFREGMSIAAFSFTKPLGPE